MEQLTFHLDNVVKQKGSLADFDGPLSLILQLLSRNRVEIQDIRISEITDQYLEYLAEMERVDLEIAGEFLTMASYLLYIKAKTILEGTQEVEEMETLISSLEEQRRRETLERMKQAAVWLQERQSKGEGLYSREPSPITGPVEYRYSHQPAELIAALTDALGRDHEQAADPRHVPMPARLPYSIDEKSDEILLYLRDRGSIGLRTLFDNSRSRSEKVATLLAVLELFHLEKLGFRETESGLELTRYGE